MTHLKRILVTLLSTILTLSVSLPVFAANDTNQLDYQSFKTDLLEAVLADNDELADSIVNNNYELKEQYIQESDAFDSDKVNAKLKDINLGKNDSTIIIMDDNSFVKVTTVTTPVVDIFNTISTYANGDQEYEKDYDMSGTRWNTSYTYEVGGKVATLKTTVYYQIGSQMDIYQYDYSGTKGSLGVQVSSVKQTLSNNKTKTATLKSEFTVKAQLGGNLSYYTLYTECGFLKAYLESDGYYYVDYYTKSWVSL